MVAKVARLMEKLTSSVLGGIAVSVQAGNVVVCIICILFGAGVFFRY
jgi:hypothetical protein